MVPVKASLRKLPAQVLFLLLLALILFLFCSAVRRGKRSTINYKCHFIEALKLSIEFSNVVNNFIGERS